MPAVLNSVWKAPEGAAVGIVLVNITDVPQTIEYECDPAECGLEGDRFTMTRIDTPEPAEEPACAGPKLRRRDVVNPQSVKIIEVRPAPGP